MPDPAAQALPVIFLNPDVMLDAGRAFQVGAVAQADVAADFVDLRNRPVEALAHLAQSMGAVIVVTKSRAPYDAAGQLLMEGVRVPLHPDSQTDFSFADRSTAIARWHDAHGSPLAVIVDRPGAAAVAGIPRIEVGEGYAITTAVVDQVLSIIDRRATTQRDA